jgi:hypothetical protein
MTLQLPESIARVIAKVPADLVHEIAQLIDRVVTSPSPRETLARALQVTAHEKLADAAVDAAFAARGKIAGTGE